MKCWNVNLVTAPHRQAGDFCPFEVMPMKDEAGPNQGGKKTSLVVGCEMFFFTLGLSSVDPCTSVSEWPQAHPPPLLSPSHWNRFLQTCPSPTSFSPHYCHLKPQWPGPCCFQNPKAVCQRSSLVCSSFNSCKQSVSDCNSFTRVPGSLKVPGMFNPWDLVCAI